MAERGKVAESMLTGAAASGAQDLRWNRPL